MKGASCSGTIGSRLDGVLCFSPECPPPPPLAVSSSHAHNDRPSQNTHGRQRQRRHEHHHRGGRKQTSPRRGDHRRAGAHRVLDERRHGEEEQGGLTSDTHSDTHSLPVCVHQSRTRRTRHDERRWNPCGSGVLTRLVCSVLGGARGRGEGPRGVNDDPEHLCD